MPDVKPKKIAKGAGPKKGQKSVRWDQDPDILYRLEQVAQMMLKGASSRQIGEAMGYSHVTAQRDSERVRELWRREARGTVNTARERSIAQLRLVQTSAWEEWAKAKKGSRRSEWLRVVKDCEQQIVELEGSRMPSEHIIHQGAEGQSIENMTIEQLLERAQMLENRIQPLIDALEEYPPAADGAVGQEVICACGCGEVFVKRQWNHKYKKGHTP